MKPRYPTHFPTTGYVDIFYAQRIMGGAFGA